MRGVPIAFLAAANGEPVRSRLARLLGDTRRGDPIPGQVAGIGGFGTWRSSSAVLEDLERLGYDGFVGLCHSPTTHALERASRETGE
jgi:hypothetical protein